MKQNLIRKISARYFQLPAVTQLQEIYTSFLPAIYQEIFALEFRTNSGHQLLVSFRVIMRGALSRVPLLFLGGGWQLAVSETASS
jgi:hypothetical protein